MDLKGANSNSLENNWLTGEIIMEKDTAETIGHQKTSLSMREGLFGRSGTKDFLLRHSVFKRLLEEIK